MEGLPDHYPTFQWRGPDGRLHRHTSSVYGGLYRKGREVEVLVDPRDPQRAQMRGLVQGGTVFTVIGAALLGFAVLGGLVTVLALYAVRSL